MHYQVKASQLQGNIVIPPSKSHTLRAILFATLADGQSVIRNYLPSPDTQAMIHACRLLGAEISVQPERLAINGVAGKPKTPAEVVDAGNSGQVLRFIGAVAALTPGYTVITGDHSIRHNRPVRPLLDGLSGLGVFAISTRGDAHAPIIIRGPLSGGVTTLNGEDSQPVSGLLIAAAFAASPTTIHVVNPGEKPWVDLTLAWFQRLDISYQQFAHSRYVIAGNARYAGFDYTVPGDFSSCAFPLVGALITGSEITLQHLDMHDPQGDKAVIFALQAMGADLIIQTEQRRLHIKKSAALTGQQIDVNPFIDAVTILAVAACAAQGKTVLTGAAIARTKESDRLMAITQELRKMGANITEQEDGLTIYPAPLCGATVSSHNDHRVAMSLAIAALGASGETIIENVACVDKSYPQFAQTLQQLGAAIEVLP